MVSDAPPLIERQWTEEAIAALVPDAGINPWGPLGSPRDVLAGAYLFGLDDGPRQVLVAVRPRMLTGGQRLDVVGLASTGERMRTAVIGAAVDALAAKLGADMLALCTARPHLVRACLRDGWEATGTVMTKKLRVH